MAISSYQDVDLFRLDAIESIGEKHGSPMKNWCEKS